MVSPLNTFLTASYASSMVNALFAPLSSQDTGTATASAATPSVSSASSSSDKVTSAAIAAIQALVKGGTLANDTGSSSAGTVTPSVSSASSNSDITSAVVIQPLVKRGASASSTSSGLPDWYTATGTTTFTPLNSTKSVTMPTDEYDWLKDGQPQTLDDVKANFYNTFSSDMLNESINAFQARGDQSSAAIYTSLKKAIQNGTVQFQLADPSVNYQDQTSVIRDGGGHITGMSAGFTMDWDAYHKVYNDSSQNYMVGGGSVFMRGVVTSWPKSQA